MKKITEKCTGCRTCEKLCPKGCITMIEDKEGFINPYINNSACVNCGMCKTRCPQNKTNAQEFEKRVYAAKAKSSDVRMSSSSGGIFYVFAKHIIEKGGVVFGAAYRDDFSVEHIKAETLDEVKALQGSKYVQSNTTDTYVECETYLKSGIFVLYTGTPCQIAGLKSYLKKSYDNLLTIDIICHGVPSTKLFKKYIEWFSDKNGSPVIDYNFRTKEGNGWGLEYKYKCKTESKTKLGLGIVDPYYSRFLTGSTYRECCYECRYANENRAGDVTIGDYWGIEKYHPSFYDNKGVSAVIVNSEIGKRYFNIIMNDIDYVVSDYGTASRENKNLTEPTKRPPERDYIYKDIDKLSGDVYFRKYYSIPLKAWIKKTIKTVLPAKVILILKKMK